MLFHSKNDSSPQTKGYRLILGSGADKILFHARTLNTYYVLYAGAEGQI